MNKVMVTLFIPVTGESYDLLLPRVISVEQATTLIASFFQEQAGGAFRADENTVLCSMEDGSIYNVNSSVEDLHLKNGSRLMLI